MTGIAIAERTWTAQALAARVGRSCRSEPCPNAFIDTRTPGSETKEDFTIIGPGVSENPDQHVHIAEPHGFNIGGARQPPDRTNPQHSRDTAEMFVVHSGRWRFDFGEQGGDAQVHTGPGDVVSFPIHAFRGFRNVGSDIGFLWSVLGGDDPGRITWAPRVFELGTGDTMTVPAVWIAPIRPPAARRRSWCGRADLAHFPLPSGGGESAEDAEG